MKTLTITVILCILTLASNVEAGTSVRIGTVKSYAVGYQGNPPTTTAVAYLFLYMNGTEQAQPGCAVSQNRYAVELTNDAGKAIMLAIAQAYALGQSITVYGDETCYVWGDSEDIDMIGVPQ